MQSFFFVESVRKRTCPHFRLGIVKLSADILRFGVLGMFWGSKHQTSGSGPGCESARYINTISICKNPQSCGGIFFFHKNFWLTIFGGVKFLGKFILSPSSLHSTYHNNCDSLGFLMAMHGLQVTAPGREFPAIHFSRKP